jgi:hypothetical protein
VGSGDRWTLLKLSSDESVSECLLISCLILLCIDLLIVLTCSLSCKNLMKRMLLFVSLGVAWIEKDGLLPLLLLLSWLVRWFSGLLMTKLGKRRWRLQELQICRVIGSNKGCYNSCSLSKWDRCVCTLGGEIRIPQTVLSCDNSCSVWSMEYLLVLGVYLVLGDRLDRYLAYTNQYCEPLVQTLPDIKSLTYRLLYLTSGWLWLRGICQIDKGCSIVVAL